MKIEYDDSRVSDELVNMFTVLDDVEVDMFCKICQWICEKDS